MVKYYTSRRKSSIGGNSRYRKSKRSDYEFKRKNRGRGRNRSHERPSYKKNKFFKHKKNHRRRKDSPVYYDREQREEFKKTLSKNQLDNQLEKYWEKAGKGGYHAKQEMDDQLEEYFRDYKVNRLRMDQRTVLSLLRM